MKAFLLFSLFFSLTLAGQSQVVDFKDTAITYTSDIINISHSPSDLISKISIAKVKFGNGRRGMQISIITKRKEKPQGITIDSFIIRSSTNNQIIINKPYRDTIYYLEDGGLSFNSIHYLDKKELDFLKEEAISKITFSVEDRLLVLHLAKTSKRKFAELVD